MQKTTIMVGYASCGIAAGARDVRALLEQKVQETGAQAAVKQTGCLGICFDEPIVEVHDQKGRWVYRKVNERKAERIFKDHVQGGEPIEGFLFHELCEQSTREPKDFVFASQERIALANSGVIDPEDIDDYLAVEGYQALENALKNSTPDDVLQTVMDRPTRATRARSWTGPDRGRPAPPARGHGPGGLRDRRTEGYVYARAEYPLAIHRLNDRHRAGARRAAGPEHPGQRLRLRHHHQGGRRGVRLRRGDRAVHQHRGQARHAPPAPPFPAESGLWGKPTNNNNVETYANVPGSCGNGAAVQGLAAPRSPRAPRCSRWRARSSGRAWSRCRWA